MLAAKGYSYSWKDAFQFCHHISFQASLLHRTLRAWFIFVHTKHLTAMCYICTHTHQWWRHQGRVSTPCFCQFAFRVCFWGASKASHTWIRRQKRLKSPLKWPSVSAIQRCSFNCKRLPRMEAAIFKTTIHSEYGCDPVTWEYLYIGHRSSKVLSMWSSSHKHSTGVWLRKNSCVFKACTLDWGGILLKGSLSASFL